MPSCFSFQYSFLNGLSVSDFWVTENCRGVSFFRNSSWPGFLKSEACQAKSGVSHSKRVKIFIFRSSDPILRLRPRGVHFFQFPGKSSPGLKRVRRNSGESQAVVPTTNNVIAPPNRMEGIS